MLKFLAVLCHITCLYNITFVITLGNGTKWGAGRYSKPEEMRKFVQSFSAEISRENKIFFI